MIKFRLFVSVIVLFHVQLVNAQSDASIFAKEIKTSVLKKHVYVLASDSCAGRNIGTNGILIARDYIIKQWIKTPTLKPYVKDSYLQTFSIIRPGSRKIHFESNGFEFTAFDDFMYRGKYDGYNKELSVLFAGFGTDQDFEYLNVKGKALIILNNNLRSAVKVAIKAESYGAELSIIANPKNVGQFESISRQLKPFYKFRSYRLLEDTLLMNMKFNFKYRYFTVSPATIKKISSHDLRYWRKSEIKGNHLKERERFISSVKVSVSKAYKDTIPAYNVLSIIPGVNTDEYIIVGAHYDHLGVIDDEIYYGADDNASGTAALIEIAGLFAKVSELGYKPQKNIIFAAFSAEEGGLCGSEYFVKHFNNPERIKLMLNIDMIGRCDNSHAENCNYFYFIGNNLPDYTVKQNDTLCDYYKLTPDYSSKVNSSDHKPFSDLGIPTIFFFDGKHQDLHKPTDTRSKIDYQRMTKISRVIFETIWKNAVMTKQETGE